MASSDPNPAHLDDTAASSSESMLRGDDSISELDLLRDLLVGDEIAELAEAREQLSGIDQQIRDPEELIRLLEPVIVELISRKVAESGEMVASAIAPIIDATIEKKIQQDKPALARILAPIISEAIRNQIESSREEIAKILAPVISDSISQQVVADPDEIIAALAPIMGAAIKERVQSQRDDVIDALSPVMGAAIKQQVRSQRDEVVDALYPVIGSTVARYIKSAFDSINEKLQDALTIKGIMRKIRAKIQGVSEAELLFKESLPFHIRAAFLIHQSGLLIAQAHPPGQPVMESEMVAGMLTAIRSFVNEWIQQSEVASEIDQIEYGTSKIILEPVGGFGYLVVVGEGEPHQKFKNQMRDSSIYVAEHFSEQIREFDGDTSTVPEEVNRSITDLIGGKPLFSIGLAFQSELEEGNVVWAEEREIPANVQREFEDKEVSLSQTATVSSGTQYGVWIITDNANDQTYTIVREEDQLNVYGGQTDKSAKSAKRRPFFAAAAAVLGLIVIFFGYNWYQNRIDRNLETKSVLALRAAPDLGLYRFTANADRGVLQLFGMVPSEHLRGRAEQVVAEAVEREIEIENKIRAVDVPRDPMLTAEVDRISSTLNEILKQPTITTRIYFNLGEGELNPSAIGEVLKIKKLLDRYPDKYLRIIGHCDRSGELKINQQLGHQRAASVRNALVGQGIEASRLYAFGTSEPPPMLTQMDRLN